MTTAERRTNSSPRSRRVRAAAARAYIVTAEYDKVEVPQWIRDVAEGRDIEPRQKS
ncbi:hypothetical protein [Rhodococcoides kyotonense]|uniref:Uncharacterized protein n=1 Tax=Rhodococcoides kyotonense TaxID=398843 RepID=A0A239EDT5_9NOCA|nr:hypothetical protein [Rhodococcus kyotonensis]SNS42767.1 hypothetical protein SAMN05421642_102329 [Rhodococcus kyotonensis]